MTAVRGRLRRCGGFEHLQKKKKKKREVKKGASQLLKVDQQIPNKVEDDASRLIQNPLVA